MIVSTYSEGQILSELISDREWLRKQIKKIVAKQLAKWKKQGYSKKFLSEFKEFITPNNNHWNIDLSIFLDYSIKQNSMYNMTCIVESEYGTPDYYYLRGCGTEKPYYIKVTSHALKRVFERVENSLGKERPDESSKEFSCRLFLYRQAIIGCKIATPALMKIAHESEDAKDSGYLFCSTAIVNFLGYKTPGDNFYFKTCITDNMIKGEEEENAYMCATRIAELETNFMITQEEKLEAQEFVEEYESKYGKIPYELLLP